MGQGNALKSQIKSIEKISKITKAMELVATAKLKKVGKRIADSKPYFAEVYTIFNEIIRQADESIYLNKDANRVCKTIWIVINSNLGLCGGYNININRKVASQIKAGDSVIAIGSKAHSFYKSRNFNVIEVYDQIDINFTYEQARTMATEILSKYNEKEYEEIRISYTKFVNNVTFEPAILQILPINKFENASQKNCELKAITEFEPDVKTVLETSVPFYVMAILFSAIVESKFSEQASRRTSMENSTNNANDIKEKLTLKYNRNRQAAITQEISEIVAGAGAHND